MAHRKAFGNPVSLGATSAGLPDDLQKERQMVIEDTLNVEEWGVREMRRMWQLVLCPGFAATTSIGIWTGFAMMDVVKEVLALQFNEVTRPQRQEESTRKYLRQIVHEWDDGPTHTYVLWECMYATLVLLRHDERQELVKEISEDLAAIFTDVF